ncbi:MAG: AAA family ATPase [Candidatus Micrarchaeota archaeon]|nr:AAA family ATPase [Candidatus Micrarchaeota archaeon]
MIKSIHLKNWRSHSDTFISFSKGTNIIIGRMGGGKSSVIDGICFALFGTTPAVQHRRLKIADFIKNRPKEESEAEITLLFEHKGEEYKVVRRVKKKGGSEAEIFKNGARVEGPQSERVTEYISHLLEIDYELFTRAIYSEQNRIDYFLTLGRGERKRQIDELIGIDKFEIARKNATTAISRLKAMKSDRETFIKNIDGTAIREEIENLEREIAENKKNKEKLLIEYQEESKLKSEKEKIVNELRVQRERFRRLQDEITGLKHNKEMLEKEISSSQIKETISDVENRLLKIKNEKDAIEKERLDIDKESREWANQYAIIKSEISNIEKKRNIKKELEEKLKMYLGNKELKDLKEIHNSNEQQISQMKEEYSQLKAEILELTKSINELKSAGAQCPVCDSELSDKHKEELIEKKERLKNELQTKISLIEKNLSSLLKESENLKKNIENAEKIISLMSEYEGIEDREGEYRKKMDEINEKIKEINERKMRVDEKIRMTNNEYVEASKEYERIKELENKRQKLKEITKNLSSKEIEIGSIKFSEEKWESENKELNEINIKCAQIKSQIDQVSEKERYLTKILEERRKRLDEIEKYAREIQIYNNLITELQIFSTAVVETQHDLREELIESINEALATIWKKIYPYSDYELIKLVPSENDYELVFKYNNDYISVDGIGSGGERALACLALRIAFAMVLTPNLSWLILDEPTHNLDEEAVGTLAETLREHIPQIVEQTFVITHDELMKEAASSKVIKIMRNPQNPETSIVQELDEISASTPL